MKRHFAARTNGTSKVNDSLTRNERIIGVKTFR